MRDWKAIATAVLGLAAMAGAVTGCQTNTGTVLDDKRAQGAIIGGMAGAATGAAASKNDAKGAGIGALVGALAGAGIGHYLENKEKAAQELDAIPDANVEMQGDSVIVSFAGEVMFDSGSRNLSPGALGRLDSVAATLNRYPDSDVIIKGHTDSQGAEDANMRLSEDRAVMVKNHLVTKGVDGRRVQTLGFGESMPLATNATPEGRAMNRRVEIELRPAVSSGPRE